MIDFDIIVVGAGIVGLTTALSLAKYTSLSIGILESKSLVEKSPKVSAISLASKQIFSHLECWSDISKKISSYVKMNVWDENENRNILFDCQYVQKKVLGYIVEDDVIHSHLFQKAKSFSNVQIITGCQLISLKHQYAKVSLLAANHETYTAKLVIAADGAQSWIREQSKIDLSETHYEQTAIVASVTTEKTHEKTAWQKFLFTGPLAFLPLRESNTSSIVWSVNDDKVSDLLFLDDKQFCRELSQAFSYRLGHVTSVSKRYHFKIKGAHAKSYFKNKIVLVGDAAHTIHPLAGQGLNLGLLDAVCLSEEICLALNKNRDFDSQTVLRRYERWRKTENSLMLQAVSLLKNIFGNKNQVCSTLRHSALGFVNKNRFLKTLFMNYALGNRSNMPTLAKLPHF